MEDHRPYGHPETLAGSSGGGGSGPVFLHDGKVMAILEAKKPGKDLWAALEQAKGYARTYKRGTGSDIPLLFASDGEIFLRQDTSWSTAA
jgi:type I site-specific restriction endonuclease